MDDLKKKAIQQIVDSSIRSFADGLKDRHVEEARDPNGTINKKRKNAFVVELGAEFMFYSALVRSFDSSFGNVLENIGNAIAKISFETKGKIESYLLPAQQQKIDEIISSYTTDAENRVVPESEHYSGYTCIVPRNIESFRRIHITDHCFFSKSKNEYYLIELKAGGDLDTKKAPAEKKELLVEYFMLKNIVPEGATVRLYFGAAYNKDGEGNPWRQSSVQNCFAPDELLIGRDYWNFVCDDQQGYEVVMQQYKQSAAYIRQALDEIKRNYFPD